MTEYRGGFYYPHLSNHRQTPTFPPSRDPLLYIKRKPKTRFPSRNVELHRRVLQGGVRRPGRPPHPALQAAGRRSEGRRRRRSGRRPGAPLHGTRRVPGPAEGHGLRACREGHRGGDLRHEGRREVHREAVAHRVRRGQGRGRRLQVGLRQPLAPQGPARGFFCWYGFVEGISWFDRVMFMRVLGKRWWVAWFGFSRVRLGWAWLGRLLLRWFGQVFRVADLPNGALCLRLFCLLDRNANRLSPCLLMWKVMNLPSKR